LGVITMDPRLKTSGMTGKGRLLGYAWLVIFNLIGDPFLGVITMDPRLKTSGMTGGATSGLRLACHLQLDWRSILGCDYNGSPIKDFGDDGG